MKDNFLIIANGQFLAKELIQKAAENKIIIALDGAAEKLRQLNMMPNVILGDFDSLTEKQLEYWKQQPDIKIVSVPDQNYTDLEKAIHYCDQHQAESITIVCAIGGRMDHHENVIHTLANYYKPNRLMLLHTEQQTLRYARDEQVTITGKPGDKCGFNAKHTGKVTSKGLVYECVDIETSFSNMLSDTTAILTVTGGALIIMPLVL